MSPTAACVVCSGFTDHHRFIYIRDIPLGLSRQCEGCLLLAKSLQLFPELLSQTVFLFWVVERALFIRLLDGSRKPFAVLELFTDPGKPCILPLVGPARTVALEPWDANSIQLARSWLRSCIDHHPVCRKTKETALPTRVVDVGTNDDEIRLYVTQNENAPYVALSHCWGRSKPIETRTSNLQQHVRSIALQASSKTFADAIRVARDLGFQYVWIDSLCIIQDDKEDWAAEAGRMSQVYSNAAVTFSAEAATSAQDGLFTSYTKRKALQVQYELSCDGVSGDSTTVHIRLRDNSRFESRRISHASKVTPNTELSSRAWVVQERLLSPRILHFYEEELAWSCCSVSQCECKFDAGIADPSVFKTLTGDAATKLKTEYNLQREWAGLVTNFSRKKLTYPTDRLPALSGLAGLVKENTNSNYFAGLWEFDVPYGLLWISDHEKAVPTNITRFESGTTLPSWSWASVDGPVVYLERHRTQFEHRTRTAEVKPLLQYLHASTVPNGPNEFGDVQAGSVTVKGQLIRVGYVKERKVWRPYDFEESFVTQTTQETPKSNEKSSFEDISKQMGAVSISSYPEPTHEPKVTFDVLDEHPSVSSIKELQQADYFFLRAGIYITGGLFAADAQENFCLLLRRRKSELNLPSSGHVYERAGTVLRGFHSKLVWRQQAKQLITLV